MRPPIAWRSWRTSLLMRGGSNRCAKAMRRQSLRSRDRAGAILALSMCAGARSCAKRRIGGRLGSSHPAGRQPLAKCQPCDRMSRTAGPCRSGQIEHAVPGQSHKGVLFPGLRQLLIFRRQRVPQTRQQTRAPRRCKGRAAANMIGSRWVRPLFPISQNSERVHAFPHRG